MKTLKILLVLLGLSFPAISQMTMDSLSAKPNEIVKVYDSKSTWTWNLPSDPIGETIYLPRNLPGAEPGTYYVVTLLATVSPETHGMNTTPNHKFSCYLYANEHEKKFTDVYTNSWSNNVTMFIRGTVPADGNIKIALSVNSSRIWPNEQVRAVFGPGSNIKCDFTPKIVEQP